MRSIKCVFRVNRLMISSEKGDSYFVCVWLGNSDPSRIFFGKFVLSNCEASGPITSQFCTCHMCIMITGSDKSFSYMSNMIFYKWYGGRLNIEILYQGRDSHSKDLYIGNIHTWKDSLYNETGRWWNGLYLPIFSRVVSPTLGHSDIIDSVQIRQP